jgi:hypothetical protein
VRTSTDIGALAEALAKAQGEIKGAIKDAENPFFKSSYADLASVWDACREPLSKHGLSVIQFPKSKFLGTPEPYEWTSKQGEKRHGVKVVCRVSVLTRLAHSSGQWVEDVMSTLLPTGDPQSVGSATTYLRRYSLQSVAGIAPEDDDGEGAHGESQAGTQTKSEPRGGTRVDSKDRPADPKAGIPSCPNCKTNKDAIVSKKGPGFWCFNCSKKYDPVLEEARTSEVVAEIASLFTETRK